MRLDLENRSDLGDHINARRINASFERADVGSVQAGLMRQLFLRQAALKPVFSQIVRKQRPDLHTTETTLL